MTRISILLVAFLICSQDITGQAFPEYLSENPGLTPGQVKAHFDVFYTDHNRGKGSGYKQYRRWLEFADNHLTHNGTLANYNALNQRAYEGYLKKHPMPRSNQRSTHGGWIQEGPTSYTNELGLNAGLGRVNRVAFHPSESNTVFACTAGGGLWKTTDMGTTWAPVTNFVPPGETTGLVIDPSDPQVMYLLTGDGDGFRRGSIGVLKTTNGGTTWKETGLQWTQNDNQTVLAFNIVMHPNNHDTIFVVSSAGIHRTTDAGVNWTQVRSGKFTDIEFCPSDPTIMYAVSDNFYKSTDSGESFTLEGDGEFPGSNRIEIAVTPADPSVVYLLFGSKTDPAGTFAGLLYSDDFGEDFSLKSNSPNILGYSLLGDDQGSQSNYDLSLAVDQFNPDIIYVGGINNWRSYDQGETWEVLSHWAWVVAYPYVHADVHQMKFAGTKLFCANDGGIFTLETTNGVWTDLSPGMCILQPYNLDVFDGRVVVGTQDNGTLRWDIGMTNATAEFGGDGFACMWDPSPPFGTFTPFYVSWQDDLLITNTDGAGFGSIAVPGFGAGQYWFLDLMMHPTNHDTIYVGVGDGNANSDVFRSYNRGGSWTDLNCGLGWDVTALAQAPSDPNIVYASNASVIVRTSNVHAITPSWDTLTAIPVDSNNYFGRGIKDIAVDPENPNIVYVCLSRYIQGSRLFKSVDGGISWQNFSGSLPNVPFYTLLVHDDAVNGIYAGSEIGVFYRNSNMSDWIYFSNDLPLVPVYQLDFDGNKLYAATFGRGIWSTDLFSTCTSGLFLSQSDPSGGWQVYHTTDFINSSQIINGGVGTDIQYNSEGQITLTSGFEVKAGNLFEIQLEDCPD